MACEPSILNDFISGLQIDYFSTQAHAKLKERGQVHATSTILLNSHIHANYVHEQESEVVKAHFGGCPKQCLYSGDLRFFTRTEETHRKYVWKYHQRAAENISNKFLPW